MSTEKDVKTAEHFKRLDDLMVSLFPDIKHTGDKLTAAQAQMFAERFAWNENARLKEENAELLFQFNGIDAEYDKLQAENIRLREALEALVKADPNDSGWDYPAAWENARQALNPK